MANSVNKVILIGHLGADPDFKTLDSGTKLCRFSIATSEKYTTKGGDRVEHTEWHSVVSWGGLADIANNLLKKGDMVYVEGKIRQRSWEDPETKVTKYSFEILAEALNVLQKKERKEA
ncbi:MAG: single-stranded DNA-binding protein [Flavobacteriales bacterium]